MIPDPFLQLFVALGLGLLVGMQRERVDPAIAGIRTFALITVFGALAALLGRSFGGWIVAVGLLVAAALVMSGNLVRVSRGDGDPGQTTEFTAVIMYCVGALVVMAPLAVPVVLAVIILWSRFRDRVPRAAADTVAQEPVERRKRPRAAT